MNRGYLYQCPPIDWWDGWKDIETVSVDSGEQPPFNKKLTEEMQMATEAIYLATKYGYYDGEINTLKYSGLPDGSSDSKIMVGLKISNNGTTYIYSKICLPWLAEFELNTLPNKNRGTNEEHNSR